MSAQERTLCCRCLKPQALCYCAQVKSFRSRVRIVLLQHPLERKKTVGTARMTHLCIENSLLVPGIDFDRNPVVNQLLEDPENHCVVLYPGPGAKNISLPEFQDSKTWVPENKTLVIFVVDGTWPCAKRMLRRSPKLLSIPQICFTPSKQSEYRFRRQPEEHCLSTIEAVHVMLEILDPSVNSGHLLELFRTLVDQQVRFSSHGNVRRLQTSPASPRVSPASLPVSPDARS
jgi:DTW domain-containing protein YfiP